MLKRTITGACYVAIIVGFFLLRELVDARLFQILNLAFISIGTFEVARALEPYSMKGGFSFAVIYGALFAPVYCLAEYWLFPKMGWLIAVNFTAIMMLVVSVWSLFEKSSYDEFRSTLFCLLYPSLLMLSTMVINDFSSNGFIALLLVFVISPCSDTMAYLVGMTYNKIRKGQAKKLCPKLSPKKTVAGAIGGVFGGALGSLILFFICRPQINFFSPVLLFIGIGLIASVLTEIGDLFESHIKRRVGIKDSGKILPGHGGVLDRIDGMMFASVFICIVFLLI